MSLLYRLFIKRSPRRVALERRIDAAARELIATMGQADWDELSESRKRDCNEKMWRRTKRDSDAELRAAATACLRAAAPEWFA